MAGNYLASSTKQTSRSQPARNYPCQGPGDLGCAHPCRGQMGRKGSSSNPTHGSGVHLPQPPHASSGPRQALTQTHLTNRVGHGPGSWIAACRAPTHDIRMPRHIPLSSVSAKSLAAWASWPRGNTATRHLINWAHQMTVRCNRIRPIFVFVEPTKGGSPCGFLSKVSSPFAVMDVVLTIQSRSWMKPMS